MSVTLDDVLAYLGSAVAARYVDAGSDPVTYSQVQDAIDAETDAQLGKVAYPVDDNDDPVAAPALDEALKRRVARNLSMRSLPLSLQGQGTEFGPVRVGGTDPEVRRLEARYRRTVVG